MEFICCNYIFYLFQVEEDSVPGIILRLYEAYGTHVSVNITVSPLLGVKHYQRCLLFFFTELLL